MKLNTFLAIPMVLISMSSGYAQSNSGLIAHWPFNGNANDSSGNGHTGTAYNTSSGTGITGKPNTAYYFDGSSSYITVPYQSDLNITRYSLCAVVKPTGFYPGLCQGNIIMERGWEYSAGNYELEFTDNPYNDCYTDDSTKYVFALATGNVTNNGSISNWQYSPQIVRDNWYVVVGTFNGTDTFKVYINGVLKSVYPAAGSIGSSTYGISIGAGMINSSYPYWYKGFIDDIRIYNRVLDDSEIKQYATGIYLPEPDTVCQGKSLSVITNLINGNFVQVPGTVFTAEISDASGSFASPTVIGTYTVGSVSTPNVVTIPCTVSASLAPGVYKLRVKTTTLAMTSDLSDLYVFADSTPTLALSSSAGTTVAQGTTVVFTANPSSAGANPSFKWYKNGVLVAGQASATYTAIAGVDFVNGDTITSFVKSSLPCATVDSAIDKIIMNVTLGVKNVTPDCNIRISPNPSNGSFLLKGYVNANDVKMNIVNELGQVIYSQNINVVNNVLVSEVKLDNVRSGVYFVRLQAEGISQIARLIIQ
ncbi:MAG: hypothetical protein BGO70_17030 [Bacteroidetes bacterium 43-93]|nr:T9SS type A sorting domain-containing protein [Bacteroidota bacterium]OJX01456.1 MAG: hypothetical protein BGO70_17030 [Bacteroidetes bacterium 43-93]